VSRPFVKPLYDTRAVEATLAQLAHQMRLNIRRSQSKRFRRGYRSKTPRGRHRQKPTPTSGRAAGNAIQFRVAGDATLAFQPYLSLQFHDGSGSNPPMQELPDPASSSIWGLPVEIDPKTAAGLQIVNGDVARRVAARVVRGACLCASRSHPGVLSSGIGDGHSHYGRYATGRGANPISILAAAWEPATGALVLGGTRVRLSRAVGHRPLIQFSAQDRQERSFEHR
jgi:hypothetical protein